MFPFTTRGFIEKVLYDTVAELAEKASFHKLSSAVRNEKTNKQKLQVISVCIYINISKSEIYI